MVLVLAGQVVRAARVDPVVLPPAARRVRPDNALHKGNQVPAAPEDLVASGAEAVLLQNP
jgi:hypothetical protein